MRSRSPGGRGSQCSSETSSARRGLARFPRPGRLKSAKELRATFLYFAPGKGDKRCCCVAADVFVQKQ